MSSILEKLEHNRTPILLAEIGAYLHLLGRFSKEFIDSNAEDANQDDRKFDYQKICEYGDFFGNSGLNTILRDENWGNYLNRFIESDNLGELSTNQVRNFCNFIKEHTWRSDPKGLNKILADAHGIVSGIDKALAGRGTSGRQKKEYTYKATAFGYEKDIEILQNPDLKDKFFCRLTEVLKKIQNNLQDITFENYEEFLKVITEYYPKTIAETRRPINEISLYDYAHAIASLMKSNLAKIIVDGWYEPRGKSQWKILKINLDVIGLVSKGLKIGDILGYRKELEEIYEKIKELIEYRYPLGNELYRDSTGIYFSCPNFTNSELFKTEIEEKIRKLATLEFTLQLNLSSNSRSMVVLAKERDESLKAIAFPRVGVLENSSIDSEGPENKEICPTCRIRLKQEKDDRCIICKERYEKRAQSWLEQIQVKKETIWLDEVADHNDRVALIVGQFDLRKWLSGDFLDTFVSQTIDSFKNENIDLTNKLSINSLNDLVNQFSTMFSYPNLTDEQKELCKAFIGIKPNNFINDFWQPVAERDATDKTQSLTNDLDKAKHLIKLLFRKHPSPARIRRIWNTTQEFIKETILENILINHLYGSNSLYRELRDKRIQFIIFPSPQVSEGSTVDIEIGGIRFSPVCIDKNNGIFVTTTNLQILSNKGDTINKLISWMNGREIKLKKEGGTWDFSFKIINATFAEEKFQNYLPYIPIYDFPDQFMVLVPAYDALDIASKVFEKYEIQFSKVSDRLPFHIGIIAFHRRTPLYVAMDAGKRLIKAFEKKTETIHAKIDKIEDFSNERLGNYVRKLTIKPDHRYSSNSLIWQISYSTGDPNQQDEWHPYIRIKNKGDNGRNFMFDYDGNGNYVVHVKELKLNDCVEIETSYFKIAFLESAVDRFKIDDNLRAIDDIKRLKDLWIDIENIISSKKIGLSQIYAFWEETERRYKDYKGDEVWEKFVGTSLTNILKISSVEDRKLFDKLFESIKDGLLELCLYWNLQVRKVKSQKGG